MVDGMGGLTFWGWCWVWHCVMSEDEDGWQCYLGECLSAGELGFLSCMG